MTDGRVLHVPGDVRVVHTIEIIVGRVVFADVVEAETEILPLAQPTHGRAIGPFGHAAGKIAFSRRLALLLSRFAARPDTVEKRRIEIHVIPL